MDANKALELQLTILNGRSKMCLFVGGPPEVESDGVLGEVLVEEEEQEEVEEEELEQQELKLDEKDKEGEHEAKEEVEEEELVPEELDELEEVEGEAEAAAASKPALAGRATIAPTLVGIVVGDLVEELVEVHRAVEPMVAGTPASQSSSSSSTTRRQPEIRESTSACSTLK